MKRLLGAALVAALFLVAAKPLPVEPSIAVADGSDLRLGGAVTFDVTVPKLLGHEYPLVYVACSQDGVKVWGSLRQPDQVFILGGAASLWVLRGGSADCTAWLYVYGASVAGGIRSLDKTPIFHAEG